MHQPLLDTKFYIPKTRPKLVPRPHMIERLNDGLHRKLTLISAPAGFGKTTLVTEWLENLRSDTKSEIAWLSLDDDDNNLTRFLRYFIAALQRTEAAMGEEALEMLQSPQLPPTEGILTSVINEIATFPEKIILVLDDYHLIEARLIHEALGFMLENQSPNLHLVITTREDPYLPISRLRVREQLTELRAADLRFTSSETTDFLNQVMRLELSAEDIDALENRTEGWIAGLQLAAISLQGHTDASKLIETFTGSHRLVLDYLIEEVLEQQPEDIQRFLLQTAILDRLTGSLCDAIANQENGQETLEALEHANLFIIPLDNERRWYRYHHLFSDLLRQRLQQSFREQMPELHSRASIWYEQNGFTDDAIEHSVQAEDFERVADLAELALPEIEGVLEWGKWLGWVKALPDEIIRVRPVLCVGYANNLLMIGDLESAITRLLDAEKWLDTDAKMSEKMIVIDKAQFQSLPASIAIARAFCAQATGNMPNTVKYARQVLNHLSEEEDHIQRGRATTLLGLASWANGDLDTARQAFTDFIELMRKVNNTQDIIGTTFVLADIKMAQGHLNASLNTYQQALQLATDQGEPTPLGTEDLYRGIGELYRERGDLEAAVQHLLTSKKLGEKTSQSDWQNRWYVTQARINESQQDLDGALLLLDEAEHLSIRSPLPTVRPITALKTRVLVKQERLTEALGWVRERELSVDDDLSYLREFEHITLARVLIAQYKSGEANDSIHQAMRLLNRLLEAGEEGRRMGSVIEILILQAIAHEAQGDMPAALLPLKNAMKLAESEGYQRVFVDEGLPVAKLLDEVAKRGIMPDYARKLLTAFDSKVIVNSTQQAQLLVEPLSERELEVLQLLAQGLSNNEIGDQLFLALNTVKGYNRKIYGKLGVKNRTQAVNKAISLKILPSQ